MPEEGGMDYSAAAVTRVNEASATVGSGGSGRDEIAAVNLRNKDQLALLISQWGGEEWISEESK